LRLKITVLGEDLGRGTQDQITLLPAGAARTMVSRRLVEVARTATE
jgi:hypothetical protein